MGTLTHDRKPPLWPLLLFGATFAVFVYAAVVGTLGPRYGGVLGGAGMLAALFGSVQTARKEHLDDESMPSFFELARESLAKTGRMFLYVVGYVVVVVLFADASDAAGAVGAAIGSVLVTATLVDGTRALRRAEGVEREVFFKATSFAWLATVAGAASYGLFEALADAPKQSMWLVWLWGLASWGVATTVLTKRAD